MKFVNGIYTVLITPFVNGEINYDELRNLIEFQITNHVNGIVILGTTSESCTMSINEKKHLVKFVSRTINNKVFLVAGVGGNNTLETLEFAQYCVQYVDGLMVTVPHYNKPPQAGIIKHFQTIANNHLIKHTPIMIYNIPGRTCIDMLPESVVEVIETCPNVVAIKEASGKEGRVKELEQAIVQKVNKYSKSAFKIFAGDDSSLLNVCKIGGSGVISVAGNVIPQFMVNLTERCLDSQVNTQETEQDMNKLIEFTKVLFIESNPIPVKYLAYKLRLISTPEVRLPLVPLDNNEHQNAVCNGYCRIQTDLGLEACEKIIEK